MRVSEVTDPVIGMDPSFWDQVTSWELLWEVLNAAVFAALYWISLL